MTRSIAGPGDQARSVPITSNFIPENNMFLNKVHGVAQRNLFTQLYGLYEKGIAFLLQCPSISSYIMDVPYNQRLSVCTDKCTLILEAVLDRELFQEIQINSSSLIDLNKLKLHLNILHE